MRTVNEILNQKGPHFNYIEADAMVIEAITLMKSGGVSYLIVQKNGNYAGIISERDYAQKVILNNKQSTFTRVKEVMTKDLPIVSGTDTLERCMLLMNASKSRYLPVFDEMEFKGIITVSDLMREAIAENKKLREALTENMQQHYWI